jgi:hypothetical protein
MRVPLIGTPPNFTGAAQLVARGVDTSAPANGPIRRALSLQTSKRLRVKKIQIMRPVVKRMMLMRF